MCTKTDDASDVLTAEVQSTILSLSRSFIQRVIGYNTKIRKVSLVNEIFHTSAGSLPDDGDPRKSPQELRDMLTALNDFNAKTEFLIPNNWTTFGKYNVGWVLYIFLFL